MFHRADLHRMLADAVRRAKPDAIHLNARCAGFRQSGGRVALHFENADPVSGEVLIGADGVHSKIRQALFGPDRPEFTGVMVWRGLVPTDNLPDRLTSPVGPHGTGPGGTRIHSPVRGR